MRSQMLLVLFVLTSLPGFAQNWSTPINLTNSANMFSLAPASTVDSTGKVHVVWVEQDESKPTYQWRTIFYTNNDTPSGQFAAPTEVPIPGYWLYISQLMLTRTSDDTLHLAVTAKICCYQSVEVALYLNKPAGGAWSAPLQLTPSTSDHFTYCQSIVALPDDSIFFLYLDMYKLISRTRSPSGVWGPAELHLDAPVDRHHPNGWARAIGDELYLSYDIPFESYGGCYYKVKRNGVWSGYTRLSNFNAQTASRLVIAKSPTTGELCATYGYDTGDGESFGSGNLNFDIYARFSMDNGVTWTPQVRVSPGNSLDRGASCVYDAAGTLHVVWYGQVNVGDYGSILYRKRTADGIWGPQVNVSNNAGRSTTYFEPIRVFGNRLHLVYSNSGSPPSGPGYEDVWYATMISPADPTPPGPVTGLSAVAGEERVALSWRNPSDSDLHSVVIRESATGYPATPASGNLVTEQPAAPDADQSFLILTLTPNVPHYFSVFAKDTSGNFSTPAQAQAVPTADVTPPASPVNFAATADYAGNIVLTWTNAADPDLRGTVIRASTGSFPATPSSGGLVTNQTGSPGAAQSFAVVGLNPGVAYYFSAFAYDAKPNYSAASHATASVVDWGIGAVKPLSDGAQVKLHSKVVTGVFVSDGCVYVEDADRASGIRVVTSQGGLAVGDRVRVTGSMATRAVSGYPAERQISATAVTKLSSGAPLKPLGMGCESIGGKAAPNLPGAKDAAGANNMGLLAKIVGRITKVLGSYLFVDDGSNVENVSGSGPEVGVMVRCPSTPGVALGNIVSAVGVIEGSIPTGWTANRRYLRLRDMSDLRVLWPPTTGAISGTVTDAYGTPLSGAVVSTETGGYTATTQSGGSYTVSSVAPGTYTITASKSGYVSQAQPGITVAAGQTTTANFTLSLIPVEVLTNGGFEGGFTDFWGGRIANSWSAVYRNQSSADNTEWTDYALGGSNGTVQSVYLSFTGGESGIRQTVSGLTPGRGFRFSAYAYASSGNSTCWIAADPDGGTALPSRTAAFPTSIGAWNYGEVTGTVGSAGKVSVFLWVWHQSNPPGTCCFDSASLMVW